MVARLADRRLAGRRLRLGLAACAALGAACGGDAFTMAPSKGDGGANDAGPDVWSSSGGAGDAGDASSTGNEAGDAGADAPADATLSDAIALPDVIEEPPAHCGGQFACVPALPPGWQGPFEVYRGSNVPASCSPGFFLSYDGSEDLTADPATCGCTCGGPTGVQCSQVTASFFVSTATVGGCTSFANHCTDIPLSPGTCAANINASSQCGTLFGTTAFSAGAPAASGGSCMPTPSTKVPTPQWGAATRACISLLSPAQVDCPSGSLCAPMPAQPFDSTWCIAQAGDVQCPAKGYTNRSVSYGGVQDERGCTACTCGPVTGGTCTGSVSVTSHGSGTQCSGSAVTYTLPLSCGAVQQPGDFLLKVAPSQPGSCTPSQPAPTGTAVPASPTTFCCQ